jgi:hypothetical protein
MDSGSFLTPYIPFLKNKKIDLGMDSGSFLTPYIPLFITEPLNVNESGVIFAPYICVPHTDESLKDYHKFMKAYRKQHEVCPKCGSKAHTSTLMGYVLNDNKRNEYKDLNRCKCSDCGDVHTAHERISKKEFDKLKKKNMKEITSDEYVKAQEVIERYKYQQKKTVQVTVSYNATVTATIQVPEDWSIDKIKTNLKRDYYGYDLDDEPSTDLSDMTELIVNGVEIKL